MSERVKNGIMDIITPSRDLFAEDQLQALLNIRIGNIKKNNDGYITRQELKGNLLELIGEDKIITEDNMYTIKPDPI